MKLVPVAIAALAAACSSSPSPPVSGGTSEPASDVTEEVGNFADAASCTPGTQRCTGTKTAVQTCTAKGSWGDTWTCATGTCKNASCSGSTTTGPSCAPGGAGMTNCGAGAAELLHEPRKSKGGTYYRTYTNTGERGLRRG